MSNNLSTSLGRIFFPLPLTLKEKLFSVKNKYRKQGILFQQWKTFLLGSLNDKTCLNATILGIWNKIRLVKSYNSIFANMIPYINQH